MNVTEMRTKTDKDLIKRIDTLKADINDSVQKRHAGELQNYRQTKVLKRELAQTMTVLREKALEEDTKEQAQ